MVEDFPSLDGKIKVTPTKAPETVEDFPALGDGVRRQNPDTILRYNRRNAPRTQKVSTAALSLADLASKPKMERRNVVLTDEAEFPALCDNAPSHRKADGASFQRLLANKQKGSEARPEPSPETRAAPNRAAGRGVPFALRPLAPALRPSSKLREDEFPALGSDFPSLAADCIPNETTSTCPFCRTRHIGSPASCRTCLRFFPKG